SGSELGQGVAYLDDGTMIVVEGGGDLIGTGIEVEIISVTRTSIGRMLFGRPVA
ncbi:MAG: twitching motility protein PilT, partial [Acidimicrobiia bacterium]|nr:twitching motility protein PilT [Acidimicrobiia bacterium]